MKLLCPGVTLYGRGCSMDAVVSDGCHDNTVAGETSRAYWLRLQNRVLQRRSTGQTNPIQCRHWCSGGYNLGNRLDEPDLKM